MLKKSPNISITIKTLPSLGRALGALAVSVAAGQVMAVDYAVQIGAFKQVPQSSYLDAANSYGSILRLDAGDGVTAYSIGPFGSRDDAETTRGLLLDHYPDAFIRQVSDGQIVSAPTATSDARASSAPTRVIAGAGNDLSGLTAEERQRVVYLDGVLHIKEGDSFTPLSTYQRR